ISRNAQWQIDPVQTMGFWKFQHVFHLAAATPAVVLSAITFILTDLFLFAMTAPFVEDLNGMGLMLSHWATALQALIPIAQGWLIATGIGLLVFLNPPTLQTLMGGLTMILHAVRDQEATLEALRLRIGRETISRLLGYHALEGGLESLHLEEDDYRDPARVIRALEVYGELVSRVYQLPLEDETWLAIAHSVARAGSAVEWHARYDGVDPQVAAAARTMTEEQLRSRLEAQLDLVERLRAGDPGASRDDLEPSWWDEVRALRSRSGRAANLGPDQELLEYRTALEVAREQLPIVLRAAASLDDRTARERLADRVPITWTEAEGIGWGWEQRQALDGRRNPIGALLYRVAVNEWEQALPGWRGLNASRQERGEAPLDPGNAEHVAAYREMLEDRVNQLGETRLFTRSPGEAAGNVALGDVLLAGWHAYSRKRGRARTEFANPKTRQEFRRALEETSLEAAFLRAYQRGEINISWRAGAVSFVLMAVGAVGWVHAWLPFWLTLVVVLPGTVLAGLALATTIARRIWGGEGLWLTAPLIAHAWYFLVRIPNMIHYFNYLVPAGLGAVGQEIRPWMNPGYWTRGRADVTPLPMGQRLPVSAYPQHAMTWWRRVGRYLVPLLVLPYFTLSYLFTSETVVRNWMRTPRAYFVEPAVGNVVDDLVKQPESVVRALFNMDARRLALSGWISDLSGWISDPSGWIIGKVEYYRSLIRAGKTAQARRLWNTLLIATDAYRQRLRQKSAGGDAQHRLEAQRDYERAVEALGQALAAEDRHEEFARLFGLQIDDLGVGRWEPRSGVSAVQVSEADQTLRIDVDLKGRHGLFFLSTEGAAAELVLPLSQPANWLDTHEVLRGDGLKWR
ncbi:MAG: hypothetical protein HYZ91_01550, partial [Candidatus Omnitrophica bacterium]|nr:hypothetical protein [Candidatus Omnitrophota bacterium]